MSGVIILDLVGISVKELPRTGRDGRFYLTSQNKVYTYNESKCKWYKLNFKGKFTFLDYESQDVYKINPKTLSKTTVSKDHPLFECKTQKILRFDHDVCKWRPECKIIGKPGPQGAQGAQGNQGETGNQGAQGAQGETGNQGAQGAQGAQGETGNQGAQGAQGAQGNDGAQGNQGAQGPSGGGGLSFNWARNSGGMTLDLWNDTRFILDSQTFFIYNGPIGNNAAHVDLIFGADSGSDNTFQVYEINPNLFNPGESVIEGLMQLQNISQEPNIGVITNTGPGPTNGIDFVGNNVDNEQIVKVSFDVTTTFDCSIWYFRLLSNTTLGRMYSISVTF